MGPHEIFGFGELIYFFMKAGEAGISAKAGVDQNEDGDGFGDLSFADITD